MQSTDNHAAFKAHVARFIIEETLTVPSMPIITRAAIEEALRRMAIRLAKKLDHLGYEERRLCPIITLARKGDK